MPFMLLVAPESCI